MEAVKRWMICAVAGSRTEVERLAPLVRLLRAAESPIEIATGLTAEYHDAAAPAEIAEGFGPDRDLREGGGGALADLLLRIGEALDELRPTAVLVAGESASALAAGLAAIQRDLPLFHADAAGPEAEAAAAPSDEPDDPRPRLALHYRRLLAQLAAVALAPADAAGDAAAALARWLEARDQREASRAAPRGRRRPAIWVAGFPSPYGGADTELDHQIALWRRHDVDVHLVPMFGADPETRERMLARGCHVHAYRDDIFRGKLVVSYCNGELLANLPRIMARGRPARLIWFNCMTWLFDAEREAHRQGWIDVFGFVSAYQRSILEPQLTAIRPIESFDYRPYFELSTIEWRYRPWDGQYRLGRISRDDMGKYAPDTWRIFDRVIVPPALAKKVYLLGYGSNAAAKIGAAPAGLDWQTWAPGAIPTSEFYRTIDTMLHKTGGSRESYCRVLIEAYAHGVVPIVEDDYAFPELVRHGETGYRTCDSDEMSWYAGMLAREPDRHRAMAEAGRRFLAEELIDEPRCWRGWEELIG
jgi:glycosyl transferase family 1